MGASLIPCVSWYTGWLSKCAGPVVLPYGNDVEPLDLCLKELLNVSWRMMMRMMVLCWRNASRDCFSS